MRQKELWDNRLWYELACDALLHLTSKPRRAENLNEACKLAIQTHRYTAEEMMSLTEAVYHFTGEAQMSMGPFEDYREVFLQKEAIRLIRDHLHGMI